ncbi:MAG: amidase [Candidatus Rokuibacteriota bacterium]|nr:MAG: amidase [Candidatus Rokubacteria bacterium]
MIMTLPTVTEATRRIREGTLSPVEILESCLARIRAVESTLRAWVHLDEAGARTVARERAQEAEAGRFRGPLHGIPVGIKDIFHIAGMPTTAGAGPFAHEAPTEDSTAAQRLRVAGAVILGKTATTEFAHRDPAETRNPWNREHTPGGSSSGSALALGTQTAGSVLRPAAYCGIVGVKPTHGLVPTAGVIPLAWSLDHVGCLARSVADVTLGLGVLAGRELRATAAPPAIGVPVAWVERAEPEVAEHVRQVAAQFAKAGARVEETTLPPSVGRIDDAGRNVMRVEAAAYHTERFGSDLSHHRAGIAELIRSGLALPAVEYVRANRARLQFRAETAPLFERYQVLLTPVAPAPAPKGLASTGDPSFCAPWSFIGVPAIALPSGIAGSGLPLGVQLIAGAHRDEDLLGAAAWCEGVLGFTAAPTV